MGMLSQFAGNTLMHQGGSFEPQRTNNFALVVTGIPNAANLTLFTKGVELPGVGITVKQIGFFNEFVKYAGRIKPFEDVTATFHDYLDADTVGFLSAWYNIVVNFQNGAIGFAKDYKKQGSVYLLPPGMPGQSPGAVDTVPYNNRIWNLSGMWPSDMKLGGFDNDGEGENQLITMRFTIDRGIPAQLQ
jgi:hypothetical protein